MARKRKAADAAKERPSRKIRKEYSPVPTPAEEDADRTEVQWALPTQAMDSIERDRSEAITRYAQTLYSQPWDAIKTTQTPFKWPPLRSPLYKTKGNDIEREDANGSSAALRNFFNTIKRHTGGSGDDRGGIYARDFFNQAFTNADNNAAVVASQSAATPVLALDRDYQVEV